MTRVRTHHRRRAFTLTEVTIAMGIMSFVMIAVYGLLPTGLQTSSTSVSQTAAIDVMTAVVTDLRSVPVAEATPGSPAVSPRYGLEHEAGGTLYLSESGEEMPQSTARFRVEAIIQPGVGSRPHTGQITVSWPASQDDPNSSVGRIQSFIALRQNL